MNVAISREMDNWQFKVDGRTVTWVFDDGDVFLAQNPSQFDGYYFKEISRDTTTQWMRFNLQAPEKKPCDEKTKAEIKAKIDELQRLYEKL